MAIKPHRPRELALVISLVGLGISVPGAALAAQDVPFGADTGDAQQSSPLQPEFDRQPIAAAIERAYGDADREPSNADVWRVPMSSALPDEAVLEAFAARMARLPLISYLGVVVDALPEDHTLVAMRPAPLAEGPGTARSKAKGKGKVKANKRSPPAAAPGDALLAEAQPGHEKLQPAPVADAMDAGRPGSADAPAPSTEAVRAASDPAPQDSSAHAQAILQYLAAILAADEYVDRPIEPEAEVAIAAPAAPPAATAAAKAKVQRTLTPRPQVLVVTQAEKVLHGLESILQSPRNTQPLGLGSMVPEMIYVTSHVDKVLLELAALMPETAAMPGEPGSRAFLKRERTRADNDAQAPEMPPAPARLHKRYPVAKLPTDGDSRPEIAAATAATLPPADRTGPPQTFAPGSINHLALSSVRLDQVRGGFTGDNGLRISFGIERAVYINGNLVTTTTLNLSELGKVSGGQVQVGGVAMGGTLGLIQNGPGNTFSPAALASDGPGT